MSNLINFTIRVDKIHDNTEDVINDYLNKFSYIQSYLIGFEVSAIEHKEHFQGIITVNGDEVSEAKRSKDFSRHFKEFPGSYKSSTRVKDTNKYSIYITKDNDIRFNKGYTPEQIETLRSQSYKKTEQTKTQITHKKKITYNQSLIDGYKESIINPITQEIDKQKISDESIILYLLKRNRAEPKGIDDFIILKQVNMIKIGVYDDTDLLSLSFSLANKLSGKYF